MSPLYSKQYKQPLTIMSESSGGNFVDVFLHGRYSNFSMFRILTIEPYLPGTKSTAVATRPVQFRSDLEILLDSLWDPAADGGNLMKVAVGSRATSGDLERIYALVQCTPDLSATDCKACLIGASQEIPRCCDSRIWVTIYRPSCNIRYETLPFYNESRLNELVGASTPNVPSGNNNNNTSRIIITVVSVSVAAAATLAGIVGFLLRKRIIRGPKRVFSIDEDEEDISGVESLQHDFDKIRAATNNFSSANKLGEGGFGAVYKGVLHNGKKVAVKRLSTDSRQGNLEFKNEVTLLAKLQHKNLVRLLCFSLEGRERLLVYEFLENSSLDNFIFDPINRVNLDWAQRCNIIVGIARGLLYLHEDSRLKIIHRDLKPSNVLLDGDMNPKISDFGTARLFVVDETEANTKRIVGTYGYMAPEYAMHGHFSGKSDVFSFGVLVLEIISGQKNNWTQENIENGMISRAWKNWHEETLSDFIDPLLSKISIIPPEILRCVHIALLCVQNNAADRPIMSAVVQMLTISSIVLSRPFEPTNFLGIDNSSTSKNSTENKYSISSETHTPITEVYPR